MRGDKQRLTERDYGMTDEQRLTERDYGLTDELINQLNKYNMKAKVFNVVTLTEKYYSVEYEGRCIKLFVYKEDDECGDLFDKKIWSKDLALKQAKSLADQLNQSGYLSSREEVML